MSKQIKLNFNSSGVLTSTNIDQIRQGDADVKLIASFEGKNNANYIAKFTLTRPDDKVVKGMMSACATPITDFERILDSAYYFAVNGAATLTVFLFSGDQVLAQGQATISIEQTDFDEETTITQDEYDELLELIATKLNIQDGILIIDDIDSINVQDYSDGQLFFEESTNVQKLWKLKKVGNVSQFILLIDFLTKWVKRSGDTMTGDLILGRSSNTPPISYKIKSEVSENDYFQFRFDEITLHKSNTNFGFMGTNFYATNNPDLGNESAKWKDLYLSGSLKDGSYSVTIANIAKKDQDNTFEKLPQTKEGRVYNNDRQMTDKGYVDNKVGEVQEDLDTFKARTDNPHQVTKAQVGLGSVSNDAQVKRTEMGVGGGVATLDQNGKLLITQLPDSITGQLKYAGVITYRSSAPNNPMVNLSSIGVAVLEATTSVITWENLKPKIKSAGVKAVGLYFIALNYNDYDFEYDTDKEIDEINTGDWLIIYQASSEMFSLQKIDNTDAVASVNGKMGVVVLNKEDIGLGNVNNTSDEDKPISSAQQAALNEKLDESEARLKLQAKVVSVDITITPEQWSEDKEFTSENVFGTLGFVNSDDLILFNTISNEDDAYANTYKVRVDDVVSTEANETYVYFKCNDIPTGNVSLRVNLIKKNTILGDMTGFLNVADLDGETVAFQEGKVRVIGGGTNVVANPIIPAGTAILRTILIGETPFKVNLPKVRHHITIVCQNSEDEIVEICFTYVDNKNSVAGLDDAFGYIHGSICAYKDSDNEEGIGMIESATLDEDELSLRVSAHSLTPQTFTFANDPTVISVEDSKELLND